MNKFVIQTHFIGDHGRPATQFFGGIGTYSHAPIWVNLLAHAIKYDNTEQAQQVLDLRIRNRRETHTYSVVATNDAKETATKSHAI